MPKDPYKKLFDAIAKVPGKWKIVKNGDSGRRVLIRHARYKEFYGEGAKDWCCPMAAPVRAGFREELLPGNRSGNSRVVDNKCQDLFMDLYGLTHARVMLVMRSADKTRKTGKMRGYDPKLRARLLAACRLEEVE